MNILSLSTTTPRFPPFITTTTTSSIATTTSISFSLKPTPPPPPPPEPTNSPSIRRPKSLTSSSSTPPKIPRNPLKTRLKPPATTTDTSSSSNTTANPLFLSTKLRLSSKLSPPPPPPPPPLPRPPPSPPSETTQDTESETDENIENETPNAEFREKGKIFVGNLPNWIKKHELSEFFRQFGPIKSVFLIKSYNETERNAGFGFIVYDGLTAEKSAMKAEEFDGMEFHGRVLTVKLDDGRRLKSKAEERKNWVDGEDEGEYRSKWHDEREALRKAFRKVLDTQPENWQAVVSAFDRIKKV